MRGAGIRGNAFRGASSAHANRSNLWLLGAGAKPVLRDEVGFEVLDLNGRNVRFAVAAEDSAGGNWAFAVASLSGVS